MHFDLLHAIVTAAIAFAILEFGKRQGWARFDWKYFVSIFVVVFIVNIIWPL